MRDMGDHGLHHEHMKRSSAGRHPRVRRSSTTELLITSSRDSIDQIHKQLSDYFTQIARPKYYFATKVFSELDVTGRPRLEGWRPGVYHYPRYISEQGSRIWRIWRISWISCQDMEDMGHIIHILKAWP